MDRGKFDKWLISLIPDNVQIIKEAICKKIEKTENGYNLQYEKEGKIYTEQAKVVIGSDGANSLVRNTFYPKHKIKRYVSIQEWYENEEKSPIYTSIFNRKPKMTLAQHKYIFDLAETLNIPYIIFYKHY